MGDVRAECVLSVQFLHERPPFVPHFSWNENTLEWDKDEN